ncbi:MAG TPA: hypothetical protein VLE51_02015 [Candidatus Saccharimonadales bacterium]|nr:hypothetical protein [Candidatus Saccharimonadales bacterium]
MMDYLTRTSSIIVLFTIAFLTLVLVKPGEGDLPTYSSAAAGIFGIFIGFSISNSRGRLNRVNQLLKTENANNLLVYRLSSVFGDEIQDKIRKLMDAYLIDQIDYRLDDFDRSGDTFHKLYEYIINLEVKNDKQKMVLDSMIKTLNISSSNRVQIETITTQRISIFEWISVWSLTFVVVFNLYLITRHDAFQSILITILASALILLVLVLRDLNNLKWQKGIWTWKPLHNLFVNMDLLPYYPRIIVEIGEAKIPSGEKVRLADYPNPYPDMTDKVINVEEYDGGR